MKTMVILYWVFTCLFAALMLFSAIPDLISTKDALIFMNKLGYPNYILPFLGAAKILGVIAILIPGYPRIKEWAYAGLIFDLVGATYSIIGSSGLKPEVSIMFIFIALGAVSYIYYHKKTKSV